MFRDFKARLTLLAVDESGMSTVEYAIGTIAAAAFAAILYAVVTGDSIVSALTNIIARALNTKSLADDAGATTVEAAFGVATLVAVLMLCLAGITAVAQQVRCIDAAREAARLAARGDERVGGRRRPWRRSRRRRRADSPRRWVRRRDSCRAVESAARAASLRDRRGGGRTAVTSGGRSPSSPPRWSSCC